MVFVPGGAFIIGSSSSQVYGPDFLISSGIILVAINYRVGAAGFLSLGSKVAPGNLGLHDTLLALQWIQDEISAFGGDPAQVTLTGQSAGAVITHFLYLSPLSTELFQRAIAQSGSALVTWGHITGSEARRRALLLAQRLNCDTSQNDTAIFTCLQNADIKDIVDSQFIPLPEYDRIAGHVFPFVPVLDTYATSGKPFFSDSLDNLIEAATRRAKPLISGFNAEDSSSIFSYLPYYQTEANLAAFLPEEERNSYKVNRIHTRYFTDTPTLSKTQGLVSLYTDYAFAHPNIKVIRKFGNFTYGYLFAYEGIWGPIFSPQPLLNTFKMKGVGHGDDLVYLFYMGQSVEMCSVNIKDISMMKNMVKWWTNFIKTGEPDDYWQTVSKGYFVINSQTSFMSTSDFESQYYDFWASIETENKTNSSVDYTTVPVLILLLSLRTLLRYLYLLHYL